MSLKIETITYADCHQGCLGKEKYKTQATATHQAKKLINKLGDTYVIYFCHDCRHWHIATPVKERPKGNFRNGRIALKKAAQREEVRLNRMQARYEKFLSEQQKVNNNDIDTL